MSIYHEWITSTDGLEKAMAQEDLILEVTESIWEVLNQKKISKSELAEMLGVSKARVTNMLNGASNITLRTLSDILFVLNKELKVSLTDRRIKLANQNEQTSVFVPTSVIQFGKMKHYGQFEKFQDLWTEEYNGNANESIAA